MQMFKNTMAAMIIFVAGALTVSAQKQPQVIIDGVSVSNFKAVRSGELMNVDMTLDIGKLDVESNRAVLLTPRITSISAGDSLELPSVGIYGRRRYYYYVRNGESMLSGKDETTLRAGKHPDKVEYHATIPYNEWMGNSLLSLHRSDWGCCSSIIAEDDGILGRHYSGFFPQLVYVRPTGNVEKHASLEGSAFIDFPVNKTVIYPDYRRNTVELGKIQATIDSVRSDRDVTITSVWLKGYASPESPYAHNTDLARGRVAALKHHIQQLYKFDDGIIVTEYEPEDWAELRRYVENSNIDNREGILQLIDASLDPDVKEARIRSKYPQDYKFLLDNCYPALRHTDYRISYDIRSYTDVEEIRRMLKTAPYKLSLNEFYMASQNLEPGSDEFTEVFETAVRLFPDDPTANLNAANAAMRRGDNTAAARYLSKAGNTPEAIYARGALAIRKADYDTAEKYLEQAVKAGVKQAAETLGELRQGRRAE